ncbi:TraR/DksA family transcriptional regulator [Candidatus Microgenomates bacterium]|nr:TraR/DksA family transcriptional regulator [Candidatus Microgenomates bacterium]
MANQLSKTIIKKHNDILEKEKVKLLAQIVELTKDDPFSDPDHASDNAAIDTDVREQVGHDTIEAEIKDLQKRVKDIDAALVKITKGTYGFCEKCSMPIPLARLELVPEARYCIDCEKKLRIM